MARPELSTGSFADATFVLLSTHESTGSVEKIHKPFALHRTTPDWLAARTATNRNT